MKAHPRTAAHPYSALIEARQRQPQPSRRGFRFANTPRPISPRDDRCVIIGSESPPSRAIIMPADVRAQKQGER